MIKDINIMDEDELSVKNVMKKEILIVLGIIIFLVGGSFIIGKNTTIPSVILKDKENIVEDKDYLYDKGSEFIKNKFYDLNTRKDSDDYQVIVSYEPLGITNDGTYDYTYMWVLSESYFVRNDNLYNGRTNSSLYKIYFQNDEVVDYYMPLDGKDDEKAESYVMDKKSIQFKSSDDQESDFEVELKSNCLNKEIYTKIIEYTPNLSNDAIIKEHYSYLSDLTISHEVMEKPGVEDNSDNVPFPNCRAQGKSGYESC